MKKVRQFILNGLLITSVSLLMRTVGVSYNVYLSNKIGAVAMGLFTLISTVYGFAITLATSGIGLATTRLVAKALGTADDKADIRVRYTLKRCIVYSLLFSIAATVLLYGFSPFLGNSVLKDARTVLPLKLLCATLIPISLSSVLSGYFVALRHAYKNALTQVLSQGIKIYSSVILLSSVYGDTVEGACACVALSGILTEGISLGVQLILYQIEKRKKGGALLPTEQKEIRQELWSTALPVGFSAYLRAGLITIEHILIPRGLEKSGASRDLSLASYGVVHSMVFPLILFPSAITNSFAGLLIPEVAQAHAAKDFPKLERMIRRVFSAVLSYAIGTAGILMCFSIPLAEIIYPETDAGRFILMVAPLVPVMYLDTSTDAFLKGMGDQFYCMIVNVVDSFLSVILVWILLPRMGINGYIVTVYFTEILNAALSIARLLRITKIKIHWFDWILRPLFCTVAATLSVRQLIRLLHISIESSFCLGIQLTLCSALYLLLILLSKKKKSLRKVTFSFYFSFVRL